MPFDQRGQQVSGHQYNAEGNMHFGGEQKTEDIAKLLETLKQQLLQARQHGTLDADVSADAEGMVDKALQQTQKPQPDKKKFLTYLNAAKGLLEGVASASGIVASLVDVTEMARRLF